MAFKLLVVDDNADAAHVLAQLLTRAGYDTRSAEHGDASLRQVQEFDPDVVLIDIGMPDMDGYELARAIRGRPQTKSVCLIAMGVYDRERDKERSASVGIDTYLVKPVSIKAILGAISTALRLGCDADD